MATVILRIEDDISIHGRRYTLKIRRGDEVLTTKYTIDRPSYERALYDADLEKHVVREMVKLMARQYESDLLATVKELL